jgi:UDP-N-acetyl-L-fucosamine synthase
MNPRRIKVATILGTRPEIIRLSRVMAQLDRFTDHILIHTGQNYDYELNEIFFNDLGIRKPDHFLNVDTSSLGAAVGDIMRKSGEVLQAEKPDALVVLGDTNSCLAAYMAKRMHIPIFHMEAGNRCFDENVPEETNRRIIDHIADFNLVYTEHARRHLLAEGLPHRRIYLTGSPMKEVLDHQLPKIEQSGILKELNLEKGKYFVVSTHREENVDNPENLKQILDVLNTLAETYNVPVIVSTHPRTRKRIEEQKELNTKAQSFKEFNGHKTQDTKAVHSVDSEPPANTTQNPSPTGPSSLVPRPLIHFLKPFGFTDYIHLQQHALCTISDSGTISEESAILGFPAISLRNSMERPEAQDAGTIILTGFDRNAVLQSVATVIAEHKERTYHNNVADYSITDTSWRVLKLILGLAGLSNKWSGVKK